MGWTLSNIELLQVDLNTITKHVNTIGIDRQDLMKSVKECIFDSFTLFKKGFSHTQNPI